ncbi:uncharacterized protein LOC112591471 [Melanaphis sacchari]|uniref:uncharacterized protein LOC112591471 n=1 Tax=Melanaphis sacchari TaxID=742174 RepID=UPI000DC146CB|nr:uncharacterized protein LOC112591471 [Melanaphis sacchari]XP_025191095.1 uncharacterized protein LOC112591471 [Melanaphis sacchari]
MSDQQGDDGSEWRKSLPGLSGSDNPLCTPKQIKNSTLDELRRNERLWIAYERGWCDLLQSFMNMQLMQSETSYMLPELARPGVLDPTNSVASGAIDAATNVSNLESVSSSDPMNESAKVDVTDKASTSDTTVPENGLPKQIDVRALASRIKRTYKYSDVRLCEFQGLGPRNTQQMSPKTESGEIGVSNLVEQMSAIRIKITTPEATEFELTDTFDDDEKLNADNE